MNTRAFTLVECLICITIIAILIALAIPALGAARLAAAGSQCLQNSRACTTATQQYAVDYRETFPFQASSQTFLEAVEFDGNRLDYYSQTLLWPRLLRSYLDAAPVPKPSLCPAVYKYWTSTGSQTVADDSLSSYNLSYGLFSLPDLWDSQGPGPSESFLKAIKFSDVSFPSQKAMLVEAYASHYNSPREPSIDDNNLLMLERPPGSAKRRPISFCDGSARQLNREALNDPYPGAIGPGFAFRYAAIMTEDGARGIDTK